MSGIVAVGSLLAVVELGGPVASNLGLGIAVTSSGHGDGVSQALENPTAPSPGSSESFVAGSVAPAPVVFGPTSPAATTSDVTSVTTSVVPSTPAGTPVTGGGAPLSSHVASSLGATSATSSSSSTGPVHASVLVNPTSGAGSPPQGDNGQQGQGDHQAQGEKQGQTAQTGSDADNAPEGKAVGHNH